MLFHSRGAEKRKERSRKVLEQSLLKGTLYIVNNDLCWILYFSNDLSWLPGHLTLSDPDYFRQLTIRGGGFKSPPPPTISKTIVSIFTISYMCILPGVLAKFQLEFFKNSRFSPFYSDFKIKSSKNSCKNNIFIILFKIDLKYTKRSRILMRI